MGVAPSGHAMGFLRTVTAFQAVSVLRSAYFPQRVHSTLSSKTLDLQVRFAHPPVGGGSFALPFLRTGMFFQNIPVFRMAYFTIKPYYGLISKTLMLQVRSAHPPMPHRISSSSCSGVSVGFFSEKAFSFFSKTLDLQVRFAHPSVGGGSFAPPCTPLSRPRFSSAASRPSTDRFPKKMFSSPQTRRLRSFPLRTAPRFAILFSTTAPRCGKRRLLP